MRGRQIQSAKWRARLHCNVNSSGNNKHEAWHEGMGHEMGHGTWHMDRGIRDTFTLQGCVFTYSYPYLSFLAAWLLTLCGYIARNNFNWEFITKNVCFLEKEKPS